MLTWKPCDYVSTLFDVAITGAHHMRSVCHFMLEVLSPDDRDDVKHCESWKCFDSTDLCCCLPQPSTANVPPVSYRYFAARRGPLPLKPV